MRTHDEVEGGRSGSTLWLYSSFPDRIDSPVRSGSQLPHNAQDKMTSRKAMAKTKARPTTAEIPIHKS